MPFAQASSAPYPHAFAQLAKALEALAADPRRSFSIGELSDAADALASAAGSAAPEELSSHDLPALYALALRHAPSAAHRMSPAFADLARAGAFWSAGSWTQSSLRPLLAQASPEAMAAIAGCGAEKLADAMLSKDAALAIPLGAPEHLAEPGRSRRAGEPGDRKPIAMEVPSAALDSAEPLLLPAWASLGRLDAWAMLCLASGQRARLARAVAAGASLRLASPEGAARALFCVCAAPGHYDRSIWRSFDRTRLPPDTPALAEEGAKLWRSAIAAGLGPVGSLPAAPEPEGRACVDYATAGAIGALSAEAERGHGLPPFAIPLLAQIHLVCPEGAPERSLFFEGLSPLGWGFAKAGMRPGDWTPAAAVSCLADTWTRFDPILLLPDLAAAGVDWSSQRQRVGDSTLAIRMMQCADGLGGSLRENPQALGAAMRALGIDLFAAGASGGGLVERLCSDSASHARNSERSAAGALRSALALAEQARPGGAEALLAARGKDRSGPMHWAALALDAEAISLFASMGFGVADLDAKGRSPAHCIAGAEGSSAALLPAFKALDALGADWGAKDRSGHSALWHLAHKAPFKQLRGVLECCPRLLDNPGDSAEFFATLAKRGITARALATMEAAALASSPSAAPAPKASRRSL